MNTSSLFTKLRVSACPSPSRPATCLRFPRPVPAQRREVDQAYHSDLYDPMYELVAEEKRISLPKIDTLALVECIKNKDQATRTVALFKMQIENREGAIVDDWAKRKKYYMAMVIVAYTTKGCIEILDEMMGNADKYQIMNGFVREVIEVLAELRAESSLLVKVLNYGRAAFGASSMGSRKAYFELLKVLKQRKEADLIVEMIKQAVGDDIYLGPTWEQWYTKKVGASAPVPVPITVTAQPEPVSQLA
jgi:hypothetical protein